MQERAHWGSRLGFVLAAAGSAVGLGNIWRFPYATGENGGGLFVLTYLACIALIGLPIMMAEIFIGRTSQKSPVGAFRALSRPGSAWMSVGWLGVVTAFVVLSFYSVVAGWSMHYAWLSITEGFAGRSADEMNELFGALYSSPALSTMWHLIFMALTISIVVAGVRNGIEVWAKILMPTLFFILLLLFVYAISSGGFARGVQYLFVPDFSKFKATSVLEAVGQAFFTLSLGMGAILTYGSYLRKDDDLVATATTVTVLDTAVAILAGLVLFPILFAADMEATEKVGLAFISLPVAFAEMPGGIFLGPAFFLLLTFAALTSAVSLLEVATAYFIDERGWTRTKASLATGGAIMLLGIPCAVSGSSILFGSGTMEVTASIFGEGEGKNWFDLLDYLATNWMLPLGGLGIATFVAWRVGDAAREQAFKAGSKWGAMYWGWVMLLRYIVPIAVVFVFLYSIGALDWLVKDPTDVEPLSVE